MEDSLDFKPVKKFASWFAGRGAIETGDKFTYKDKEYDVWRYDKHDCSLTGRYMIFLEKDDEGNEWYLELEPVKNKS